MKKIIISSLLTVILILSLFSVANADRPSRFKDNAALLDDYTQSALESSLDALSEKYKTDVVIVTTYSVGDKSSMEYADDYYDNNGYGFGVGADGMLLLVNMQDRELWISTCGKAISAFTDAGIDYILDEIYIEMGDGLYAEAFEEFITLCDTFLQSAENGTPIDYGNLPKQPFSVLPSVVISLVIGFIAAFIVTGVMKGKLKTVRFNDTAAEYERSGSLKISKSNEYLLYTHIDRVPIPKSSSGSSTHSSSSGRVHGGGRSF